MCFLPEFHARARGSGETAAARQGRPGIFTVAPG
jgi:hypothetical protein